MNFEFPTKPALALLDFFLPRICPSCSEALNIDEEVMCAGCIASCTRVSQNRLDQTYAFRFKKNGIISGYTSLFLFENDKPVRALIHSAKYGRRFKNALYLGRMLAEERLTDFQNWHPDIIIPIPLHSRKEYERGYNQSFYISKGISTITGINVSAKAVKRIRYTETQTFLSNTERQENIKGAFRVRKPGLIAGKKILLVDDVMTTGSTLQECARALKTAAASEIYAATAVIA